MSACRTQHFNTFARICTTMNYTMKSLGSLAVGVLFCYCTSKSSEQATTYTKIDSLTETYLLLKDSMLNTWNRMMYDDNLRIKAMKAIIHELKVTGKFDQEVLNTLDYRIDQLVRIRYTPKTMMNTDVVEEYDFASNSLVAEIIAITESYPAYSYNSVLQELLETVRKTDQRIETHRTDYDAAARAYNQFIDENKLHVHEIDQNATLEKKPLFYADSE